MTLVPAIFIASYQETAPTPLEMSLICHYMNIWYYYSLVEANWYPVHLKWHFMSGDKNPIAAMFIESDMSYGEHKML